MKSCAGLDLNGWHDRSARNWVIAPDGERLEELSLVDGGVFGSVVKVGDRWIGGAQAALAPHGRTPGWGNVGQGERRVSVRDLLCEGEGHEAAMAGAVEALAHGADYVALAIDDVPRSDELGQERLIAALRKAGARQRQLVWRPVLVALWAVTEDLVGADQMLGVLCHDRDGISVQRLRIRRESGRTSDVLAPERRSAGELLCSAVGYSRLEETAAALVHQKLAEITRANSVEPARSVGRLALGRPVSPEMLRTDLGGWVHMAPPEPLQPPGLDISPQTLQSLADCDLLIFETLTSGALRQTIHASLKDALGYPLSLAPETTVALGALEAAQRHARREPVYFDFLPQISTIVAGSTSGTARNYDLIDRDATLPAGSLYRSPRPAVLGLPGGSETIKVHLRKETAERPRRAVVDFGTRLTENVPVDLFVEQAPLSGRARIILQSPALSRQHVIDWDRAEELDQDWQSLIETLEAPLPTLPNRLVLNCGMQAWEDGPRGPGLLTLLADNDGRRVVDWKAMATRLSQRPRGLYCISSDGTLPSDVSDRVRAQLDRLTERALEEELVRLELRSEEQNERLRFLTWQFRRCPPQLVEALLPAISDRAEWQGAFPHWAHWKLVLQGLGRAAATPDAEAAIFKAILRCDTSEWKWWGENACLSFLLSRSQDAPEILNRSEVERIGAAAIADFDRCHGSRYTSFFYAPFLMAGLLRWRLSNRRALVIDDDPLARSFDDAIVRALPDLTRAARGNSQLLKYRKVLEDIREELRGTGSNPELLLDIYGQGNESEAA